MDEPVQVGVELTVGRIGAVGSSTGSRDFLPSIEFSRASKSAKQRANSSYSAQRLANETPEKRAERLARMRAYAKRRREVDKEKQLIGDLDEPWGSHTSSPKATGFVGNSHILPGDTIEELVIDEDPISYRYPDIPAVPPALATSNAVKPEAALLQHEGDVAVEEAPGLMAVPRSPATMYDARPLHTAFGAETSVPAHDAPSLVDVHNAPPSTAADFAPAPGPEPIHRRRPKRSFDGETPEQREFRLARMRAYNHRYTHFIKKGLPPPAPAPEIVPSDDTSKEVIDNRTCAVCRMQGHNRRTCPTFLAHKEKALIELDGDEIKATNAAFLACARELDAIRPKVEQSAVGDDVDATDGISTTSTTNLSSEVWQEEAAGDSQGSGAEPVLLVDDSSPSVTARPEQDTTTTAMPAAAAATETPVLQSTGSGSFQYGRQSQVLSGKSSPQPRGPRHCRYCGGKFHDRRTCPQLTGKATGHYTPEPQSVPFFPEDGAAYAQGQYMVALVCSFCHEQGHDRAECRHLQSTLRSLDDGSSASRSHMHDDGVRYDTAPPTDSCPSSPASYGSSSPQCEPSRTMAEMAVGITGMLPRRCTFCHTMGHNRRTCTALAKHLEEDEMSGEASDAENSRRANGAAGSHGMLRYHVPAKEESSPSSQYPCNDDGTRQGSESPNLPGNRRCTNCKQHGHNRRNCTVPRHAPPHPHMLHVQPRMSADDSVRHRGEAAFQVLPDRQHSSFTHARENEINDASRAWVPHNRQCSHCRQFGHDKRICPRRFQVYPSRGNSPRSMAEVADGSGGPAHHRPAYTVYNLGSASSSPGRSSGSPKNHMSPRAGGGANSSLAYSSSALVNSRPGEQHMAWHGQEKRRHANDTSESDSDDDKLLVIDESSTNPVDEEEEEGSYAASCNGSYADRQAAAGGSENGMPLENVEEVETLRMELAQAERRLERMRQVGREQAHTTSRHRHQRSAAHSGLSPSVSTSVLRVPPGHPKAKLSLHHHHSQQQQQQQQQQRDRSPGSGLSLQSNNQPVTDILRKKVLARVEAANSRALIHGPVKTSASPPAEKAARPPASSTKRAIHDLEKDLAEVVRSVHVEQPCFPNWSLVPVGQCRRLVQLLGLDECVSTLSELMMPAGEDADSDGPATCSVCQLDYPSQWYEDEERSSCEQCGRMKALRQAVVKYCDNLRNALFRTAILERELSTLRASVNLPR